MTSTITTTSTITSTSQSSQGDVALELGNKGKMRPRTIEAMAEIGHLENWRRPVHHRDTSSRRGQGSRLAPGQVIMIADFLGSVKTQRGPTNEH